MFQCDPVRLTVACSSYGDITSGVVEAIAAILQLREPWRRGGRKEREGGRISVLSTDRNSGYAIVAPYRAWCSLSIQRIVCKFYMVAE